MAFSTHSSRRSFLLQAGVAGAALSVGTQALAQAAKKPTVLVSESDPTAKALKYHTDAKKVDAKANPKFKPGQDCSNCILYKGDAKVGTCSLFGGKLVPAGAWCNGYNKKP